MQADLNNTIIQAQSPNKEERDHAENTLFQLCDSDPNVAFKSLLQVACSDNSPLSSKQFALLSIRKFTTMYWSAGFDSYRGPRGFEESTKSVVRNTLLQLCLESSQDNTIRNICSYCIVQIAAIDYPDQWPELLPAIYKAILQHSSLNALSLLNEMFDDIVSEEMFFQNGIGPQTIQIVLTLLTSSKATTQSKMAAVKLHRACLFQLQSPEATRTQERKNALWAHVQDSINLLLNLLKECDSQDDRTQNGTDALTLKTSIYENLQLLKTGFPRKLFSSDNLLKLKNLIIKDLESIAPFYYENASTLNELNAIALNELGINLISLLSDLYEIGYTETEQNKITDSLILVCCLSNNEESDWIDDYNSFVSKETGLASSYFIRDECEQFLMNLNAKNYSSILGNYLHAFTQFTDKEWRIQESLIFVLQALCSNEEESFNANLDAVINVLRDLNLHMENVSVHQLVKVRMILALPKILERFVDKIENIRLYVKGFIEKSLNLAVGFENETVKASALIALTYYASFVELHSVLGDQKFLEFQKMIITIVENLLETCEDDTPAFLLESLGCTLVSHPTSTREYDQVILRLVLQISAKDPSNIQVVLTAQDCLEKLLENTTHESYIELADICIPLFVNVMKEGAAIEFSYSPVLSLSLELLTVFMKKKPTDGHLPANVVEYVFEPLSSILVISQDDEILQLTTDIMAFLVNNSANDVIAPFLQVTLSVLEKLLSVNTSESAAMNVGLLIVTILEKFSDQLQEMIPRILEAATNRLIDVKNVATADNLIFVFCYLTSIDPARTIDFLSLMKVKNGTCTALELVLPKWLSSFEVVRGERRIKDNILALSKIFFLNDYRVSSLPVNGDLIPYAGDIIITRSMAKKMPEQYTKISAYDKIIKLFIMELSFQVAQPDENNDNHGYSKSATAAESKGDEDDDDWEDVDDVLDYEKLQTYVDDEDSINGEESDGIVIYPEEQGTTKELLIQFFKEVAAKNVSNFSGIYDRLSADEKRVLSEALV